MVGIIVVYSCAVVVYVDILHAIPGGETIANMNMTLALATNRGMSSIIVESQSTTADQSSGDKIIVLLREFSYITSRPGLRLPSLNL